jgi:aspartate kinase
LARNLVIVKFGGSIIDSSDNFLKAAQIIRQVLQRKDVVIVVSAMKGETDKLLSLAKEVSKGNIPKETLVEIVSMGERTSARLLAASLGALSIQTRVFDPADSDWPIITNNAIDQAEPILEETKNRSEASLLPLIEDSIVPIVCGFLGQNKKGEITSLGRGGSDSTAVLLGNVLNAEEVILVKDVSGVLSGDPNQISQPISIKELNSQDALTLTSGGSQIIQPKAIRWKPNNLLIRVVGFNNEDILDGGTVITGESDTKLSVYLVSTDLAMITLVGEFAKLQTLGELFGQIDKIESKLLGVSVDRDSITAYFRNQISKDELQELHDKTMKLGGKALTRFDGLAMLAVIGNELETTPHIIDTITSPLKKANINLFGLYTSNSQIKIFVRRERARETFSILQKTFLVEEKDP